MIYAAVSDGTPLQMRTMSNAAITRSLQQPCVHTVAVSCCVTPLPELGQQCTLPNVIYCGPTALSTDGDHHHNPATSTQFPFLLYNMVYTGAVFFFFFVLQEICLLFTLKSRCGRFTCHCVVVCGGRGAKTLLILGYVYMFIHTSLRGKRPPFSMPLKAMKEGMVWGLVG